MVTRQAVKTLMDANGALDTWLSHFDLGRAYLSLGAWAEADSEFERCINRRGEALSFLVDDEPTYSYFPIVHYYQGVVREGLQSARFSDSYREYLRVLAANRPKTRSYQRSADECGSNTRSVRIWELLIQPLRQWRRYRSR